MGASELAPAEVAALHEALDDEYKAWATYDQVLRDFGAVRPFSNIIQSGARHIAALAALFGRYGVAIPPNPWLGNIPRYGSVHESCEASVRGELENEKLYRRLLKAVRHEGIRAVFERLRDASQQRHFPAFQRCVSRGPNKS